ncbi:ATP-binding protein [Arthrobacter sp. D2-10]
MVWNSLDAEANNVTVSLLRNEASGVVGVTVEDDGHGISTDELGTTFKWVGNSWKRNAQTTKGYEARPLHGKRGQGRLRAFALGTAIRWRSVADDTAGARFQCEISATVPNRNDFSGPDPIRTTEP